MREEKGGVKDFLESIGDGVSGRLNSPFAFGFIVSVIIINWKSFLILALSSGSIEERINSVSSGLVAESVLVKPFLFSVLGVLFFNMGGILFGFISGIFDSISSSVSAYFNKKAWVKVSDSLSARAQLEDRVAYLERVASGDLSVLESKDAEINSLRIKIDEISGNLVEKDRQLLEALDSIDKANSEFRASDVECRRLRAIIFDAGLNYSWIGEDENFRYRVSRFVDDVAYMLNSHSFQNKFDVLEEGEVLKRYIVLNCEIGGRSGAGCRA